MTRFDPTDPLVGHAKAAQQSAAVARHNAETAETDALVRQLLGGAGTVAPPPRQQPAAQHRAAPVIDYAAIAHSNAEVPATPTVRNRANALGVCLATVRPTGAGGRITLTDVKAAATTLETTRRQISAAAAAAAPTTRPSVFVAHQLVRVDEYGTNPLAADIAQTLPEKYAAATGAGDSPPTLFESGDLPVFTASGITPSALIAVPWPARHVIARLGSEDAAYLLNKFTPGPTSDREQLSIDARRAFSHDEENRAYQERIRSWFDAWQPTGTGGWAKADTTVWKP